MELNGMAQPTECYPVSRRRMAHRPICAAMVSRLKLERPVAHLARNSDHGFIFHKVNSSQAPIIFETIVLSHVHPACEVAGIKFHGFHAFRRGLDTWMKDAGIDYSLRADITRHSPRNVTDKYYGRASVKQM